MSRVKLGVRLESLGLPLRSALSEAEKMGVGGVQLDAAGELAPPKLSDTGRRQLRTLLRSHGLEPTALGVPLRRGLDTVEDQQPRLDHVCRAMTLAFELGARVVVVESGRVPEKDDDPRRVILRESLNALGRHGDRVGVSVALETGLEAPAVIETFLDSFDTGSLGVNFDPANLLMHDFDPQHGLRVLSKKIVHAHARDARSSRASRTAQEVPLGHGDIDWMTLMVTLSAEEYAGWVVVERESGESRLADVANGVAFLRRFTF